MKNKVIASNNFSNIGPLFAYAEDKTNYSEHTQEMETLFSYDEWAGSYQSYPSGKITESYLSRYKWVKVQRALLHKVLFGSYVENKLTIKEIREIVPRLQKRLAFVVGRLNFFEGKDLTGLSLDSHDIRELRDEKMSLEREIEILRKDIRERYSKRIIVVYDEEDSLVEKKIKNEPTSDSIKHATSVHGRNSRIKIKNADAEKRKYIAGLFLISGLRGKLPLLNEEGKELRKRAEVFNVLSTYTYFLKTGKGLLPFSLLNDVAEYLYLHDESKWGNVIKFKVIPSHERSVNNEIVSVKGSISTYPIIHDVE